MYADDLTVFLEPSGQNLRCVMNILDEFYYISGLKISVSKTKAVWFGSMHDAELRLCPDIELQWVKGFNLLGVEFDNNLVNMNINFEKKMDQVCKLLINWSNRHLTPFGKVTVIKTLGMSKLSHLALVIPSPSKDQIKRIERILYKFMWNNGSEKVRREDTKMAVYNGGLGMLDIGKFWMAFKFSWFRRLLSTQAFWPHILMGSVARFEGGVMDACRLIELGSSKLNEISKKIKNPFWRQILASAFPIVQKAAYTFPEKIINSPLFANPLVLRNRPVKHSDFPELVNKIRTLADLFYPSTNKFMDHVDLCVHYDIVFSLEKFIDLRFTVETALKKLNLHQNRCPEAHYPLKPFLIDIATMCTKGCNKYYKILTNNNPVNGNVRRENRWHAELEVTMSTEFWEKSRKLYSSIDCDNKLKWLQFQIVRNSLPTNRIVCKFRGDVGPVCSICMEPDSIELISHLFWHFNKVQIFLQEVKKGLQGLGIEYSLNMLQFLFGVHDRACYDPQNIITLLLKKYIWSSKFKQLSISFIGFKHTLRMYSLDLSQILLQRNNVECSEIWNTIYTLLTI